MAHTKGEDELQQKSKSRLANVFSFGAYRKPNGKVLARDLETYASPFSQTQSTVKRDAQIAGPEVQNSSSPSINPKQLFPNEVQLKSQESVLERSLRDAPQQTRTDARQEEAISEKDIDIQIRRRSIELRDLTGPSINGESVFSNPRNRGEISQKSHIESLLEKIRNIDLNDVTTRFDRPKTVRSMVVPTEPSVQKALRHLDKEIHATQVQAAKNFIAAPSIDVEEETAIQLKKFVSGEGLEAFAQDLTHERISTKRQEKPRSPEMLLTFSNENQQVKSFNGRAIQGDLFIEHSLGIMNTGEDERSYFEKRVTHQDKIFSSKQINTVTMMASWVNTISSQRKGALLIQPDFIRIDQKLPITHEAFIGGVLAEKARTSCLLKGRAESDMGNSDLNVLSVHLFRPKVLLDSEQTQDKPHPLQARDFRSSHFSKWLEPSVSNGHSELDQVPLIEHFLHEEIDCFGRHMKIVLLEAFKMAKMLQAEGVAMDEKSLLTLDFSVDKRVRLCQDHGIIVTPTKIAFLAQIYFDESGNRMTLGEAFARCSRYRDLDSSKIEMTDMPISLVLAHLLSIISARRKISDKAWSFLCLADQLIRRGSAVSRYETNGQTKTKNKQLTDLRLWLIAEQQNAAHECQQGSHHFLSPTIEFVDASGLDARAEFEHYTRPAPSLEREDIVALLGNFSSLTADLKRAGVFCEKVHKFLDSMTA